jgi:hypothetical protein
MCWNRVGGGGAVDSLEVLVVAAAKAVGVDRFINVGIFRIIPLHLVAQDRDLSGYPLLGSMLVN